MFDYIIVTQLPSFYKVNLYNEISKHLKIFVVFISDASIERSSDFTSVKMNFEHCILNNSPFETRNFFLSILGLIRVLLKYKTKKYLVTGWNLAEFWLITFFGNKEQNCIGLESTIHESSVNSFAGLAKRMFLKRISTVFACGKLHISLAKKLGFNGKIIKTRGVGIINSQDYNRDSSVFLKKFIFIGRLIPLKNLELVINVFNTLPEYQLTLVGEGELSTELKSIANSNIKFLGYIDNMKLGKIILEHNVLILPSTRETWGLVVEEALSLKIPAIVSDCCGASELIEDGFNGFIFDPYSADSLKKTLTSLDSQIYSKLVTNIGDNYILEKDKKQVLSYIGAIKELQ